MNDRLTHEEQENEARIKRAKETGGIHCDPSAAPTREERGVLGPNEKKLITKRMATIVIPKGGSALDGFNALIHGDLGKIAKEASEWVSEAIKLVRSAPDSTYVSNEEIAAAILEKME